MSKFAIKLAKMSPSQQRLFLEDPNSKAKTGQLSKLYKILINFDFIAAKINHDEYGIPALINDYDLVDDAQILALPEYDEKTVKTLKLIQGALRLSVHILNEDTNQLTTQLWGRLQSFKEPKIQKFLKDAQEKYKKSWLRPLTASLNRPNGLLLFTLTGHDDAVNAVALTSDNKWIISGSNDKSIKVWNLGTRQEEFTLIGHDTAITSVALTPDDKFVISGSSDGIIKIWSFERRKEDFTLTGHKDKVDTVVVTSDGERLISGSLKEIKVWDFKNKVELLTINDRNESVKNLVLTPDNKFIISASNRYTVRRYKIRVSWILNIWDLKTGEVSRKIYGMRNGNEFGAIAISPNGQYIFYSEVNDSAVKKFQKIYISSFEKESRGFLRGHIEEISSIATTPDGQRIITCSQDNTIKIWSIETEEELFNLNSHCLPVNAITVTLDGRLLISASDDKTLKVWNLSAEENINHDFHRNCVNTVSIIPDKNQVISGSEDGNIYFWNIATGRLINSEWNIPQESSILPYFSNEYFNSIKSIAVSKDNKKIITALGGDKTFKVWNIKTQQLLFKFKSLCRYYLPNVLIYLVILFFSYYFLNICFGVINAIDNKFLEIIIYFQGLLVLGALILTPIHDMKGESVLAIDIDKDDNFVASASANNTVKLWNFKNGRPIFTFSGHENSVNTVAFTPDSKYLISGSTDTTIKAWDVNKRKLVFTFLGHKSSVKSVLVTPDGKKIISASSDGIIKIWDLETREELSSFISHNLQVNSIIITPNGKYLISASSDASLKIWELSTQKLFARFIADSPLLCCAVAPDGKIIIAGEASGRLHFLRLEEVEVSGND